MPHDAVLAASPGATQPEPIRQRRAVALLWLGVRPDRGRLALACLWLLAAGALDAAGPLFGRWLIDGYLLPGRADAAAIGGLLAAVLGCGVAASVLRYVQLLRLAAVAMEAVRRLRERVFGHVLALPMAFFDRAITGQLVSRITNDTEAVRALYVQALFELLQGATLLIGALVAMSLLDWRLMLIVLTLVPAVGLIVWGYRRLSGDAVARTRELRSDINAQMSESIAGMGVLQAVGAAPRFAGRFAATNQGYYRSRLVELRANAWLLRPALDLLNVLLVVAVIGAVGARQLEGVEVGVLYAFVSYITRVVEPLIQITLQFGQLQQSLVAASRLDTLLSETGLPEVGGGRRVGDGAIALHAVSFGYDPQRPVLHDLSLQMPAGGFYGVVGHTGSGKSTLVALLNRLYAPQSGALEIDGIPVAQLASDALRTDLALVPQEPFVLAGSAADNIRMGRALPPEAIERAARAARVHEVIAALPQGYDTPLGERGARLSVGQKQLLALARALAGNPRILFLDEATSRIDSETEGQVQEALAALRGRLTVVAIAHRLSTIRAADRIFVLNHGRLAEAGTHDELMAREGGIYQRLYQLQFIEAAEELAD